MKFNHLLFDLDNTLYPSSSDMDKGMNQRILENVANFFHCSMDEAIELKKKNIIHHSTTMEWLCHEGLTDIEGYLAHVHPENEADELLPQPGLREYLKSLDYKKSILTNAPIEHAQRVLEKLEIADLFISITDIRDSGFKGKPYSNAYEVALKKTGQLIEETLFLDDMQKYTDGWNVLGGTSILVGNKNGLPLDPNSSPMEGKTIKGKTYRIDTIYDLKNWLEKNIPF